MLKIAVGHDESFEDSHGEFEPMKTTCDLSEHRSDPFELELMTVDVSSSEYLGLDALELKTIGAMLLPFQDLFAL